MKQASIDCNAILMAWGKADFNQVVKHHLATIAPTRLPLQQALQHSSYLSDNAITALVLNTGDDETHLHIKLAIFFKGVIGGCHCADDPGPIDEIEEQAELLLTIDRSSGLGELSLI